MFSCNKLVALDMTDRLKYDFCEVHIYDNYMIVIINEGETILPRHNQILINIAETYFVKKAKIGVKRYTSFFGRFSGDFGSLFFFNVSYLVLSFLTSYLTILSV